FFGRRDDLLSGFFRFPASAGQSLGPSRITHVAPGPGRTAFRRAGPAHRRGQVGGNHRAALGPPTRVRLSSICPRGPRSLAFAPSGGTSEDASGGRAFRSGSV